MGGNVECADLEERQENVNIDVIRDDLRSAVVLQSPEAMFGAAARGTCERKFPAWSSGGAEEVPALGEQVQFFS